MRLCERERESGNHSSISQSVPSIMDDAVEPMISPHLLVRCDSDAILVRTDEQVQVLNRRPSYSEYRTSTVQVPVRTSSMYSTSTMMMVNRVPVYTGVYEPAVRGRTSTVCTGASVDYLKPPVIISLTVQVLVVDYLY